MIKLSTVLCKALIIAITCSAIGFSVWKGRARELSARDQLEISDVIQKTIEDEARRGTLLPEIVFINSDCSQYQQLSDSLIGRITQVITNRYLGSEDQPIEYLDINPIYSSPEHANDKEHYLLNQEQQQALQQHILFLTKQVEEEVNRTKAEVGRDIDRLNTWVSIWIGVIAFIGIFVPLVINLDTSKKVEDAKKSSIESKSKSIEAKSESESAIKIASGINERVKETEQSITIIVAINSLKDIGPMTIVQMGKERLNQSLKFVLNNINDKLPQRFEDIDPELVGPWLAQIAVSLQSISFSKYLVPKTYMALNSYSIQVFDTFENLNQETYQDLVQNLHELIEEL